MLFVARCNALAPAVGISIVNSFSKVCSTNSKPLTAAALSREVEKIDKYAADCSIHTKQAHKLITHFITNNIL